MSRAERVTVPQLLGRKHTDPRGQRIVMVTCYDATFARLVDASPVDVILVGDSLGMVIQGREHTLEVTVEEVAYHARCVARVVRRAQIVADMPFMSYQVSTQEALRNAGRLIREGGAQAVKLEGAGRTLEAVESIVAAGIPVMGHLGLTPQSVHAMGGFKVQARDEAGAEQLRADARALQDAGCYALVLEGIPADLAREVSESIEIPTIGIGAGPGCDGQVLVLQDLLGLDAGFKPKFVKRYAELGEQVSEALAAYAEEVRAGSFPSEAHSFGARRSSPDANAPTAVPSGAARSKRRGYGPQ